MKGQIVTLLGFNKSDLSYSVLPLQHKNNNKQYVNKWAWLCSNKTLIRQHINKWAWLCSNKTLFRQHINKWAWLCSKKTLFRQTGSWMGYSLPRFGPHAGVCWLLLLTTLWSMSITNIHFIEEKMKHREMIKQHFKDGTEFKWQHGLCPVPGPVYTPGRNACKQWRRVL